IGQQRPTDLDMHLRDQAGEPACPAHEQPVGRRCKWPFTSGQRVLGRFVTGRKERRPEDLHGSDRRGAGHDVPGLGCDTTTLTLLPPKPNALTSTCERRTGVSSPTTSTPRLS